MNCEKKENSALKTILVVIGAIAAVGAIAAGVYYLIKKYFKVSFDNDDCDECDECDCNGCFVEEDDRAFEPICDCNDTPAETDDNED